MPHHVRRTALFGEWIAAAFEQASRFSKDPAEVSRLATVAVAELLKQGHPLRSRATGLELAAVRP
jgi:hypothetical protein